MANQLFIVCPFSFIETFLQNIYGDDILFLTFSGAVIQFQEVDYNVVLRDFIIREKIKNIYIVNDTSCRFINGIITRSKISMFPSENAIEELYVESYLKYFKDQPLLKQKSILAELNVKNQMNEIINSHFLGSCISEFEIKVKGIITSRENKLHKLIQPENN